MAEPYNKPRAMCSPRPSSPIRNTRRNISGDSASRDFWPSQTPIDVGTMAARPPIVLAVSKAPWRKRAKVSAPIRKMNRMPNLKSMRKFPSSQKIYPKRITFPRSWMRQRRQMTLGQYRPNKEQRKVPGRAIPTTTTLLNRCR